MTRHDGCRISGSWLLSAAVKYHYRHCFFAYSVIRKMAYGAKYMLSSMLSGMGDGVLVRFVPCLALCETVANPMCDAV